VQPFFAYVRAEIAITLIGFAHCILIASRISVESTLIQEAQTRNAFKRHNAVVSCVVKSLSGFQHFIYPREDTNRIKSSPHIDVVWAERIVSLGVSPLCLCVEFRR